MMYEHWSEYDSSGRFVVNSRVIPAFGQGSMTNAEHDLVCLILISLNHSNNKKEKFRRYGPTKGNQEKAEKKERS